MAKAKEEMAWNPLEKVIDQAREYNDQAVKFARDTAEEVRTRSEAAVEEARKQSQQTLKLVQENIKEAQKSFEKAQKDFEKSAGTFDLERLPEYVRAPLASIEKRLRKAVSGYAKGLDLATTRDIEALKRKVSALEKRVGELARGSEAA